MSEYERRTVIRLCRHVPGIDVEWSATEAGGYYTIVAFNGVRARAHIGDGFITFKVRSAVYYPSPTADPGTEVVPVRKMARDRRLLADWFAALHGQAAHLRPVRPAEDQ